jgi:hypothetical protein
MAALWVFLLDHGVETTNNRAERALRFAVMWRKRSHGTHSDKGSQWALLIHRINPGPEQDNLAFLLQHRLAHYLPKPQALLDVLLRLSTSPLYRAHWQQVCWQAAEHERAAARERARQNTELIVRVAARQEACPGGWRPAGHVGAS